MANQYSLGETVGNCIYLLYTKIKFPGARLIRLPFYLRGGKRGLRYGKGLTLGYGCRFETGDGGSITFGENCRLNERVHIVSHESVTIGDNVLMASNIFITDTSHGAFKGEGSSSPDVAPNDRSLSTSPTRIGSNVWVGEGACVMPGVTIGDGCTVGANAVVTKSFPPNTVIAGVPARALRVWDPDAGSWERA